VSLCYLIHFDTLYMPYPDAARRDCAEHYTGRVRGGPKALARRLAQHGTERGAKLLLAVQKAGITWRLARVWEGGAWRERQLKRQGGAKRRCPLCGVKPQFRRCDLPRNSTGALARSLLTEDQKHRAGVMTAFDRAEHARLRHGVVTGRVCNLQRLPSTPIGDEWYTVPRHLVAHN